MMSLPIAWVSGIWLVITSTFLIWPTVFNNDEENGVYLEQDPEIFNYTCVVFGAVFILEFVYWFFPKYGARHFFVGPKRFDKGFEHKDSSKDRQPVPKDDQDIVRKNF